MTGTDRYGIIDHRRGVWCLVLTVRDLELLKIKISPLLSVYSWIRTIPSLKISTETSQRSPRASSLEHRSEHRT